MQKIEKFTEYCIMDKLGECIDILPTREMARNIKRYLKEDFNERTKILQRKYVLQEQREVR